MTISVENDFQQKVMRQTFDGPTHLATAADVQQWRSAWMEALKSWHSPYKLLVDCRHLRVADAPEVRQALDLMVRFFQGFFLRKVVGYGRGDGLGHEFLPFEVHESVEEAAVSLGIRQPKDRPISDLRSAIQLQNHFQQHTIELSFLVPVTLATKDDVETLKSKLMNNLMQWHSKWSLLIDCVNLEIAPEALPLVERMLQILKGFFMKKVIGYSPRGDKASYPFEIYRSRHRAAAALESEGSFSGDEADCRSRKPASGPT